MKKAFNAYVLGLAVMKLILTTAAAGDNDSLVNERIPIDGEKLEAHWNIDCGLALQTANEILQTDTVLAPDHSSVIDVLKKCAHIYNQPYSEHYRPEPDYNRLLDQLSG